MEACQALGQIPGEPWSSHHSLRLRFPDCKVWDNLPRRTIERIKAMSIELPAQHGVPHQVLSSHRGAQALGLRLVGLNLSPTTSQLQDHEQGSCFLCFSSFIYTSGPQLLGTGDQFRGRRLFFMDGARRMVLGRFSYSHKQPPTPIPCRFSSQQGLNLRI